MTPDRRSVLTCAGLAALAVGASRPPGCARTASRPASRAGAAVDVAIADVPVGGGVILPAADHVVTQPTPGEFRAFDTMRTHQGCPVSDISDGQIRCRCHGAAFSIEDGSVTVDGDTPRIGA